MIVVVWMLNVVRRAARQAPWFLCLLLAGCATPSIPLGPRRAPVASLVSPGLAPVRTVVIDAGHGGHDPGTSHNGLREKDLNLDIARRLRSQLTASGVSVVMTRDRDEFLVLSRRPSVANRLPADLFVSIHVNANRHRHVAGSEVYYPRESVITTSSALPPRVQPAEVASPSAVIRNVLWDLVLSRSRRASAEMASSICASMQRRLGVRCHGTRGARFVVLREAWMPAVLVEVGYLTNRREALLLGRPSYRQAVSEAIAEGVAAYARSL